MASSAEGMAVRMLYSRNNLSYNVARYRTPHAMLSDTGTYFGVELMLCTVRRHLLGSDPSPFKVPEGDCEIKLLTQAHDISMPEGVNEV